MEWASNGTELFNEFTIVADKAEKALCFFDCFKRDRPVRNGFHFVWVYVDGAVMYDVT